MTDAKQRGTAYEGAGKRSGSRRGERQKPKFRLEVLLYALGITVTLVAWGYLVKSAIDFGIEGRAGESGAWGFLALACVGAVACLFVALMLLIRLLQAIGMLHDEKDTESAGARPVGGRRRAG